LSGAAAKLPAGVVVANISAQLSRDLIAKPLHFALFTFNNQFYVAIGQIAYATGHLISSGDPYAGCPKAHALYSA
jgi:hypothetical protein